MKKLVDAQSGETAVSLATGLSGRKTAAMTYKVLSTALTSSFSCSS